MLAILFLKAEKAQDDHSFFPSGHATKLLRKKKSSRKLYLRGGGRKKKIKTILKIFNFCKNDYNSAVDTHLSAWPNFTIFANVGLLMTNEGVLKSSDQGGFVLGLLAGGRHNYKNNNLVQGNQTVRSAYAKK